MIREEIVYSSFKSTPSNRVMTSFLYLRSPREFIRIAGSLPFLPHRLMVSGDTRKMSATSRIVSRSGKSDSDTLFDFLFMIDIVGIIYVHIRSVKSIMIGQKGP